MHNTEKDLPIDQNFPGILFSLFIFWIFKKIATAITFKKLCH